jgi:8-oxo-dGTP pyrophosphatase MutT (NUDIX family)
MKTTHAGCIVYRENEGKKEYLVITAKKAPHDWVLPKGHIEAGENEIQATLRELKEEVNLAGTIERNLGLTMPFSVNNEEIVVRYYLVLADENSQPGNSSENEKRQYRWLTKAELLQTITFPEVQPVLAQLNDDY